MLVRSQAPTIAPIILPGRRKRITCQSMWFRKINALDGFASKAAMEMIGATMCAPRIKVIIGIKKVAAPPAATVLKNQASMPKKNNTKKVIYY